MSERPDARRSNLRAIVAEIDAVVGAGDAAAFSEPWRRLVAALDLGPEPALRACPRCKELGMLGATRCGYCWFALPATSPSHAAP
jgi:hypothetical protein